MYYIQEISEAFNHPAPIIQVTGTGDLPSSFRVTDLAAETIGYAGAMLQRYARPFISEPEAVVVDRRLASFWFDMTIRPLGWELPPVWDAVAGNYQAGDGWVRLHTNAPHHRNAALAILDCDADREVVARKIKQWQAGALEQAIVSQGGCAAAMYSLTDWQQHPQGRAVQAEPLIHLKTVHRQPVTERGVDAQRPLKGLRVLDLTRVLAGPVASRFLAAFGAQVLRIDPPDWDEPAAEQEVTLGKRCARMNLHDPAQLAQFKTLLAGCDVFLHGYRPGALDALGLSASVRREINPGAIDVSLNAYGWSGPWRERRGFDSLVQMSAGLAHQGRVMAGSDKPVSLPVQALDHATGYLLAASVIHGLIQRRDHGDIIQAQLSLARTGELLASRGYGHHAQEMAAETVADLEQQIEITSWGKAQRVKFPLHIQGCPARWDYPASRLGSSAAGWLS